jgi:hypothetical protein
MLLLLFRRYKRMNSIKLISVCTLTSESNEAVSIFSEMRVNTALNLLPIWIYSVMIPIYCLSIECVRLACVPYFLPHKTREYEGIFC